MRRVRARPNGTFTSMTFAPVRVASTEDAFLPSGSARMVPASRTCDSCSYDCPPSHTVTSSSPSAATMRSSSRTLATWSPSVRSIRLPTIATLRGSASPPDVSMLDARATSMSE